MKGTTSRNKEEIDNGYRIFTPRLCSKFWLEIWRERLIGSWYGITARMAVKRLEIYEIVAEFYRARCIESWLEGSKTTTFNNQMIRSARLFLAEEMSQLSMKIQTLSSGRRQNLDTSLFVWVMQLFNSILDQVNRVSALLKLRHCLNLHI